MTRQQVIWSKCSQSTRRTWRGLSMDDIELFCKLVRNNPHKRVRVYSHMGFVPNAYRYPCAIEWIERTKEGRIRISGGSAQRPCGDGPHAIVGRETVD